MASGFQNTSVFGVIDKQCWFSAKVVLDIALITLITAIGCSTTIGPDLDIDPEHDDKLEKVLIRGEVFATSSDFDQLVLEGATVVVHGGNSTASATTDSKGRFQLRVDRHPTFLHVRAPGYWGALEYVDPVSPSSASLEMHVVTAEVLARALGLSIDETKGILDIHFWGHKGRERVTISAQSKRPFSLESGKQIPGNRLSDDIGHRAEIIFPLVDAGNTDVIVEGGPRSICTLPTNLQWPVLTKTVTYILVLCSELVQVSGQVVDDQDNNVSNASVTVELDNKIGNYSIDFNKVWDREPLQFTTEEDGDFSITVPLGRHFVRVDKERHWGSVSMLEINAEDVDDGDVDQDDDRSYPVFRDSFVQEKFFDGGQDDKSLGIFVLSSPEESTTAELRRSDTTKIWAGEWLSVAKSDLFWFSPIFLRWFSPMEPGQVTVVHGEDRDCHVTMNPWSVRANTVTIGTSFCQKAE